MTVLHDRNLDPEEPLSWVCLRGSPPDWRRFELSSRGDRVPGSLSLAGTKGPAPLLLIAETPAPEEAQALQAVATAAGELGVCVARIDLPLHGSRSEHKLAACVDAGFAGDATMLPLATEFLQQSVEDLRRTLDALAKLEEVDTRRVAFAGVGLAAEVGTHFCAAEPRVAGALLALGGRGSPMPLDAARCVAQISPRPLLIVDRSGDAAAGRLQQAAGAGATCHAIDDREALEGDALRSVASDFIRKALGL